MEQQELWVLLIQVYQFPWHFRVKVAGHVVGESIELQVTACAGKQDLLLRVQSNGAWSCAETSGEGDWEC
jgi:hypothetical protein